MTYAEMKKLARHYQGSINTCTDYGGCLLFEDDRKHDVIGGNGVAVFKGTGETYPFHIAILAGKVTLNPGIRLNYKTGKPEVTAHASNA